jgi:hypothetical protein
MLYVNHHSSSRICFLLPPDFVCSQTAKATTTHHHRGHRGAGFNSQQSVRPRGIPLSVEYTPKTLRELPHAHQFPKLHHYRQRALPQATVTPILQWQRGPQQQLQHQTQWSVVTTAKGPAQPRRQHVKHWPGEPGTQKCDQRGVAQWLPLSRGAP